MVIPSMIITAAITVLLITPNDMDAEAATSVSYKCENRYDTYKSLGEAKFVEKYRNTSIISDCLKLYKDPGWYFAGKSKIDKYYEQKMALEKSKASQPKTDILWSKVAGNGKYLINYKICANNQFISQPAVLISSRAEEFLAVSYGSIAANSCKTFQTPIKAHSANDIAVKFISNTKDPQLKSVKIVNLERK